MVTHGVPLDRFYFILLASSDVETKPNQIFFFPLWRLFFVISLLFWGNNCTEKYKTSMYTHEWPKHARVGKYPRTCVSPVFMEYFSPRFHDSLISVIDKSISFAVSSYIKYTMFGFLESIFAVREILIFMSLWRYVFR